MWETLLSKILPWPPNGETASIRLPPAVHVAVPHSPPLMLVPALGNDPSLRIDLRGAEEVGNVQGVRKDVELRPGPLGESEGRFLSEVGVRALVVEVVDEFHGRESGRNPGGVREIMA